MEHQNLLDLLHTIRQTGISNPAESEAFQSLKEQAIAHLRYEDSHFYPELMKTGHFSNPIPRTVMEITNDMKGVSPKILQAFDGISTTSSELESSQIMGLLDALIRQRIRLEEEFLFRIADN